MRHLSQICGICLTRDKIDVEGGSMRLIFRYIVLALTVLGVGVLVTPAQAMVNGAPDTAHPEAGAVYFSATPTGARHFACSGALIDTQVFLTAAHCFAGYVRSHGQMPVAWVTFDQQPGASPTFYTGTVVLDPSYTYTTTTNNLYADDVNDFAVVHLTQDPGITPAQLIFARESEPTNAEACSAAAGPPA